MTGVEPEADIQSSLLNVAGNVQGDDDIDFQPDQFGRKVGKLIQFSFRGSKFKCNVLPFHIAKFTQSFAKFFFEELRVREAYVECTYARDLGLLCTCRLREIRSNTPNESDKISSPHPAIPQPK